MLDPRGNETRGHIPPEGAHFSSYPEGVFSNGSVQPVHKKSTVKELLLIRRQKWGTEPKLKYAKIEAVSPETSPHLLSPPAPIDPNPCQYFPPAVPEIPLASPVRFPPAPAPLAPMSLFHWQIQQEAQKVETLSAETLSMQDSDRDTFLHIAVAQGKRALAYVLAAKMAGCGSLDIKEHNGQTALQIAAATDQHLIVGDLLTHGAQINTRDLWGRSPLHVCAEKGHLLSLQTIWKTLTGSGQPLEADMFNYDGLTPLHTAVLSHNAVVKETRLLENPCRYMTAELAQKRRVYLECVRTLMNMGGHYGVKDLKSGRTCLHMASEEANVELLGLFLEQQTSLAVVNEKTFSGNTALHVVSSLQKHPAQAEAVKLLMKRGADPGSRNCENEQPSQLVPEGPLGEKVRRILKGKYIYI
ncbi:NF-kappa-B inhibitor zeta isoform 1-T2 [Menidia menidia]